MAVLVKGFGGSEKVTIDGEKVKEKLDLVSSTKDVQLADLPYNLDSCPKFVVFNNEIHLLNTDGTNLLHYKWDGSVWTTVSTPPKLGYACSAVIYNNEIHLLGGDKAEHHKWDGSAWTKVSTLPEIISQGIALVYNNEIHVLDEQTHYKWNGSTWTSASTLPHEMDFSNHNAAVYNNEIHVLGQNATRGYTKTHYKWNGSTWTSASTLPVYINDVGVVSHKGELHLFGCYKTTSSSSIQYNGHYKWDGSTWTDLCPTDVKYNSNIFPISYNGIIYLAAYDYSNRKSFCKQAIIYEEV